MSSLPTPNFVLTEEWRVSLGLGKDKVLPVGAFVRPIEDIYLPTHIKESQAYKWLSENEIFVFSSYGIICIPKKIMRKV